MSRRSTRPIKRSLVSKHCLAPPMPSVSRRHMQLATLRCSPTNKASPIAINEFQHHSFGNLDPNRLLCLVLVGPALTHAHAQLEAQRFIFDWRERESNQTDLSAANSSALSDITADRSCPHKGSPLIIHYEQQDDGIEPADPLSESR